MVYLGAVFDAPWGPHFGLSITVHGNPDDILLRVLVKPTLPHNCLGLLKQKPKENQEKIADKSRRQQARDEELARGVLVQSEH